MSKFTALVLNDYTFCLIIVNNVKLLLVEDKISTTHASGGHGRGPGPGSGTGPRIDRLESESSLVRAARHIFKLVNTSD